MSANRYEILCARAHPRDDERGLPEGTHAWWHEPAFEPARPSALSVECPRCGAAGEPTGEAEIRGRMVRVWHGPECGGWLLADIVDAGRSPAGRVLVPRYRPCEECRPEVAAVAARFGGVPVAWERREECVEVWVRERLRRGGAIPDNPPGPKDLWRRVGARVADSA